MIGHQGLSSCGSDPEVPAAHMSFTTVRGFRSTASDDTWNATANMSMSPPPGRLKIGASDDEIEDWMQNSRLFIRTEICNRGCHDHHPSNQEQKKIQGGTTSIW